MAPSVAARSASDPDRFPDKAGPSRAKAHLKGPTSDFRYGAALWDVLVAGHGSVKSAAITMGNTDPSLLRRQVLDGTLPIKKLFESDDKALADLGEFLVETFGKARKSKAQIAREKLPEMFAAFIAAISEGDQK